MDYAAFKRELVCHIARMARLDWAVDQARHTCKQLAYEHPWQFHDLPQLVRLELERKDSEPSS